MFEQIRKIFFEYSNLIILIPLFISVVNLKKSTLELKLIFYYLVLATITQAVSFAFWKINMNNFPILHVYTILEYLLLLWFYSVILNKFIYKAVFVTLSIAFPVFSILDSIFIESIFTFNTYGRSLEALIFIFLSISWFVKIVAEDEETRLMGKAINIINSGFLIYFAGSIAMFSYSSYVEQMSISFRKTLWTIHTVLTVQLYILIAIGLWRARTK
jgi:hypothetical protein